LNTKNFSSRELELYNSQLEKRITEISELWRGKDITKVLASHRDLLVSYYETRYPENAKKMDDFLKPVAKDSKHAVDVQNIKYLAYAAPEHYQNTMFKYLPEISIVDYAWAGTQHYHPEYTGSYNDKDGHPSRSLVVNLGTSKGLEDKSGAYFTFYHEIGHGVDNAMNRFSGNTSDALFGKLEYDTYIVIAAEIKAQFPPNPTRKQMEQMEEILNSLKPNGTILTDRHLIAIRNTVVAEFRTKLSNPKNNGVASDVYEGITNNNVTDNWGHYSIDPNYWFDASWNATGAQNREFFAGNFAINITGYQDAITSVSTYFPKATAEMEIIIQTEANK